MSTFAPLQFLKSAQNPLVWTAIDNGTDTRTSLIIYYGAVNTLPADTELYEVNCIMMHQAEKQLYANIGTTTTPNWQAFGPGSAYPQPLVPGSFLFTDGATVYWATQLVGQVQYNASNLNQYGILNFNSLLVASNDVPNSRINVDLDVVALGGDATFISTLEGNLDLANIGGFLDLSTQVTGILDVTNIDVTGIANSSTFVDALVANTYFTSELANNATFIGDLITEINLAGDIAVVADGVTITGTGTTLDPLVAVGGGSPLEVEIDGVSLETGVTKINFINGPTGTNPVAGEVDIDFSALGGGGAGTKIAIDTTEVTVGNTTTETTLFTVAIPAGTLGTNDAIRFSSIIRDTGMLNTNGETLTLRVKYGATTVASVVINDPETQFTGIGGNFSGVIIADGATNVQKASAQLVLTNNYGETITDTTVGITKMQGFAYGTGAEDSTTALNLVITAQWSAASATNTITTEAIIVEKVTSEGGGVSINITAGEDLTAGDTVGYASFIEDTAMKAVWAYREQTQTGLAFNTSVSNSVCEIDTDKYVVLIRTNEAGINYPLRAVVVQLDRDTMTWTIGTVSAQIRRPLANVACVKLDTNKFAVAYFLDTVNYEVGVTACSVSGTTISVGSEDTLTSSDNGDTVDLVQLGGDRFAMLVTGASVAPVCDLFEVTVSGTTPTITAPTTLLTPSTNDIGLITTIGTNKIAAIYENEIVIATVSGGSWTIGTPVTLPSSIVTQLRYGKLGLVSNNTDEVWVSAESSDVIYYLQYTVSGTVPTLAASGSYSDAGEELNTLATDGTGVYLITQSSNAELSGIAKLIVNGASIDRSPVIQMDMSSDTYTTGYCLFKNNCINSSLYFGVLKYDPSFINNSLVLDYYIQGMTPNFIGIAQSTVSRGASVQVKIAGVDTHQTGLTAGALYDAFEGGIVNTATQSFNTMQAQNPTDIKI